MPHPSPGCVGGCDRQAQPVMPVATAAAARACGVGGADVVHREAPLSPPPARAAHTTSWSPIHRSTLASGQATSSASSPARRAPTAAGSSRGVSGADAPKRRPETVQPIAVREPPSPDAGAACDRLGRVVMVGVGGGGGAPGPAAAAAHRARSSASRAAAPAATAAGVTRPAHEVRMVMEVRTSPSPARCSTRGARSRRDAGA